MSGSYWERLDSIRGVVMWVEFETVGREVVDYAVVLVVATSEGVRTVRVYDGVHGFNEVHRYESKAGKSSGKRFHSGTLGEGMRAAISEIKRAHEAMIDGWEG
jgi:hypothetical protein